MSEQFAVHRNPGRNRWLPFVVNVQSNRFRQSTRRVVIPLVDGAHFGSTESDAGPRFSILGQDVILDPLQMTNLAVTVLGASVASMAEHEDRIANAIDAVLSRAWFR